MAIVRMIRDPHEIRALDAALVANIRAADDVDVALLDQPITITSQLGLPSPADQIATVNGLRVTRAAVTHLANTKHTLTGVGRTHEVIGIAKRTIAHHYHLNVAGAGGHQYMLGTYGGRKSIARAEYIDHDFVLLDPRTQRDIILTDAR